MADPVYLQQQAARDLISGINTMQMQAGLVPGGLQGAQGYNQGMPFPQPQMYSMSPQDYALQQQYFHYSMQAQVAPPRSFGGSVSPMRRPSPQEYALSIAPPSLPPPLYGTGRSMARQVAESQGSHELASIQSFWGGTLPRHAANAMGGLGGFALAGPIGGLAPLAMESSGFSQGISRLGSAITEPLILQRQRALAMQNLSSNFVVGGSDLSNSGMGLSYGASRQLVSGINSLADNKGFQAQTGGMFNREDLMKITRLGSEMGMFDNAQNVDQIKDSVKKISKSLSNFMRVVEEPDFRKALEQMSKLKNLGFSPSEMGGAAANARMFSRMAGTDPAQIMEGAGMQGASLYRTQGFSGAVGMNAGMAAAGFGRMGAAGMSDQQLALAGGRTGVQNAFLNASARMATTDAFLAGSATLGRNGQLTADPTRMMQLARGELSLTDFMRQGADNVARVGPEQFITRRRELQDSLQRQMGPQMQMLMPLIAAQAMNRETGIGMRASLRSIVGNEQESEAIYNAVRNPEFFRDMQRQIRVQQNDARLMRNNLAQTNRDAQGGYLTRAIRRNITDPLSRRVNNTYSHVSDLMDPGGYDQDISEEVNADGGELLSVARRSQYAGGIAGADMRDALRAGRGVGNVLGAQLRATGRVSVMDMRAQQMERNRGPLLNAMALFGGENNLTTLMTGPNQPSGFLSNPLGGFSQENRGGLFDRQAFTSTMSFRDRAAVYGSSAFARFGGQQITNEQILGAARNQASFGLALEGSERTSVAQTVRSAQDIQTAGGTGAPTGALGAAADAFNKYLESKSGLMASITGSTPTEREAMQAITQNLRSQGFSESQVAAVTRQGIGAIGAAGRRGRSEGAAGVAQQIINRGATNQAILSNRRISAFRADAAQAEQRMLGGLGASGGFFSAVSAEERANLMKTVTRVDENADKRRRVYLSLIAERAGDNAEAERIRGNLDPEEVQRLTAEIAAAQGTDAQDPLSNMSEDAARAIHRQVKTTGVEKVLSGLGSDAARRAEDAQAEALDRLTGSPEAADLVGGLVSAATPEAQRTALNRVREHVRRTGGAGMTDEMKGLIERGDVRAIRERLASQTGEQENTILTGAAREQIRDLGMSIGGTSGREFADRSVSNLNDVLNSIQRGIFGDQDTEAAAGARAAAAATGTPQEQFARGVVTFSEASDKLLRAAEAMETSGSAGILNGLTQSSDFVGGALLGPLLGSFIPRGSP